MLDELPSRFYRKHDVLIGSETNRDKKISAHNWRIYVQVSGLDRLENVRVTFYLHPSFYPNDAVEVSTEPFETSGVAFGDFPFRVRIWYSWRGSVQTQDFFHLVRMYRSEKLVTERVFKLSVLSIETRRRALSGKYKCAMDNALCRYCPICGISLPATETCVCQEQSHAISSSSPSGAVFTAPLRQTLELHQPRIPVSLFLGPAESPKDAALKIVAALFISDLLSRLCSKYSGRAITPSVLHAELVSVEQFDCISNLYTAINEQ